MLSLPSPILATVLALEAALVGAVILEARARLAVSHLRRAR